MWPDWPSPASLAQKTNFLHTLHLQLLGVILLPEDNLFLQTYLHI